MQCNKKVILCYNCIFQEFRLCPFVLYVPCMVNLLMKYSSKVRMYIIMCVIFVTVSMSSSYR